MANCPWGATDQLSDFCEADLCAWLIEPGNVVSNLAFVIVGVWIWKDSTKRKDDSLKMLSVVCILTGVGSSLFHATGLTWAGKLDMAAMYLGTGAMTALNVKRWLSWSLVPLIFVFALTSLLLIVTAFLGDIDPRLVYALGAPCCLIELRLFIRDRAQINYKYYLLSWLIVGVAFFFWWLDISRNWCHADNHVLSGHIIWHLFSAAAFWFFYQFYTQFSHPHGSSL